MTKLESWIEEKKQHFIDFGSLSEDDIAVALLIIEKLKGVIHHVAKREHKPWLKKCLEDALLINPEDL